MPDDGAGIQLTVLGPTDSVDDGRLADLYAYPDDLQSCWVRGNMIASLDGGATDEGKAGGLAGAGDRAVFTLMRNAADVIVVGAATVRIENYSGAQLPVAARQERQRRGQAEVPPIAVITQSGNFDPNALSVHPHRGAAADPDLSRSIEDTRRRLGAVAEVIDASGSESDSVDRRHRPEDLRGPRAYRVLTEGGPLFLGSLIENDLLDELCLTVAPILVGGVASAS